MDRAAADALLACLGGDRVVFRYFEDRYALQLLAYAAWEGKSPSGLRRGRFRPLLQKPSIRRLLGERDGRGVEWAFLDAYFPRGTQPYELTFALWGDELDDAWFQTTRPGFNLVVQLNFPPAHDRAYRRFIAPGAEDPFVRHWHPVLRTGDLKTMSWSRIDLDVARGEALIEEIQSDWIRDAEAAGAEALASLVEGELDPPCWLGDAGCDAADLFRYVEYVLAPHRRIWAEATLAASLWLLRGRLGVRRVYLHTHGCGSALKRIKCWQPPRSLYETLPRAFCFERVDGMPAFLPRSVARRIAPRRTEFWRLTL